MSDALGRGASALGAAIGKGLARETPAGKRKGMSLKGDVRAGCGRATADPRGGSFLIRDQEIRLGGGRGGAKEGLVRRTRRHVSTDLLYLIVDPLSRVWTYGRAAACPQPKNAVPFKRNGNKALRAH